MNNRLPRVLSISLSAWRADSNVHTQTDLFKYWNADAVAQIYTKATLPNTPVCNRFFQLSENLVMKSVMSRKTVGRSVKNQEKIDADTKASIEQEQKLYAIGHRKKSWLLTLAREFVWLLGCWKSPALDEFIEDYDADVYFVPIYPVVYMGRLQKYILKKYPKPYVCYLADDNYTYASCGKNPLAYIHRFWLRGYVKDLAENCTEMFTITQTQGDETDACFGTKSIVLTKGIDYTDLVYQEIQPSTPIRMVYTGNLLIGRVHSLVAISKAMEHINENGLKLTLDIYSPTEIDDKSREILNANGCTHHGNVPQSQVAAIQAAADVVIFAESLEREHRYAARLSFSTKLTDYFKSGKCIFAIGDQAIAPIIYLKENDAAMIATTYEEIEHVLQDIVQNPEKLDQYGRQTFACGQKNHNADLIRERFVSTLKKCDKYISD